MPITYSLPSGQELTTQQLMNLLDRSEFRYGGMTGQNYMHYAGQRIQQERQRRIQGGQAAMTATEQVGIQDAFRTMVGEQPVLAGRDLYGEARARSLREDQIANLGMEFLRTSGETVARGVGLVAPETGRRMAEDIELTYPTQPGWGRFAGRVGAMALQAWPAIATAGAALPLKAATLMGTFGAPGAGGVRMEVAERRAAGQEISGMDEWGAALATGATEVLAGAIHAKIGKGLGRSLARFAPQIAAAMKVGGAAAATKITAKLVAQYLTQMGLASVAEGSEEWATQIVQNAIAKRRYAPEREYMAGAGEAFKYGAAMPLLLGPLGMAGGAAPGAQAPPTQAPAPAGPAAADFQTQTRMLQQLAQDETVPDETKQWVANEIERQTTEGQAPDLGAIVAQAYTMAGQEAWAEAPLGQEVAAAEEFQAQAPLLAGVGEMEVTPPTPPAVPAPPAPAITPPPVEHIPPTHPTLGAAATEGLATEVARMGKIAEAAQQEVARLERPEALPPRPTPAPEAAIAPEVAPREVPVPEVAPEAPPAPELGPPAAEVVTEAEEKARARAREVPVEPVPGVPVSPEAEQLFQKALAGKPLTLPERNQLGRPAELIERISRTKGQDKEAILRFTTANMGLLKKIANRLKGQGADVGMDDLVAVGIAEFQRAMSQPITKGKYKGQLRADILVENPEMKPSTFLFGQAGPIFTAMKRAAFPPRGRKVVAKAVTVRPEISLQALAITEAGVPEVEVGTAAEQAEAMAEKRMGSLVEKYSEQVTKMKAEGRSDEEILKFLKSQTDVHWMPQQIEALAAGKRFAPAPADSVPAGAKALLDRVNSDYGTKGIAVLPTTQEEVVLADWARDRGLTVQYVDGLGGSVALPGVTLLQAATPDSLWKTIGHEVAHATGLDKAADLATEREISEASERYMATVRAHGFPAHLKILQGDPDMVRQEGIAMLVGDVMSDPATRARMSERSPGVLRRIWRAAKRSIRSLLGRSNLVDDVIRQFQTGLASPRQRHTVATVASAAARADPDFRPASNVDRETILRFYREEIGKLDNSADTWRTVQLPLSFVEEVDLARVSERLARTYSKMVEKSSAPPVIAGRMQNSDKLVVVDGKTRIAAARMAGETTIVAHIPESDAAWLYGKGNEEVYWSPGPIETDVQNFKNDLAKVMAEAPKVTGRPELANPMDTEPRRRLQDYIDGRMEQAGQPEKQTEAQWRRQGQKILADKAKRADLEKRLTAREPLESPAEEVAAQEILRERAEEVLRNPNQQNILEIQRLAMGRRAGRTEIARIMRAGVDAIKAPADRLSEYIAASITELPENLAARIAKAEADGKLAEADKIRREWSDRWLEMLARWKKEGIDIETIDQRIAQDEGLKWRLTRDIERLHRPQGFWGVVQEWRRNMLMYAPLTLARNLLGGPYAIADTFVTKPMADVIRRMTGERVGGETVARAHAFASTIAIGRALRNLTNTFMYEVPTFDLAVHEKAQAPITGVRQTEIYTPRAITGEGMQRAASKVFGTDIGEAAGKATNVLGHLVRLPQRINAAIDQFFKTLHAHGEVATEAVKLGRGRGLQVGSQEMQDFVDAQLEDMGSESWSAGMARGETQRVTFQAQARTIEQVALDIRSRVPFFGILVPFIKTPVQLAGQAAMHVPGIGAIEMARKGIQAARGREAYTSRQFARHAAQQLIGMAGLALIWQMVGDDKDERKLTGPASYAAAERAERITTQERQPYMAFKYNGKWRTYRNVEPYSQWIGTLVSVAEEIKRNQASGEKPSRTARRLWSRVVGLYSDQTYVRQVGDIIKMIQDPSRYTGRRAAVNLAGSWLPNIVDVSMRDADPFIRERRVMGTGPERPSFGKEVLREMAPTQSILPPPKVDFFGNEMKVPGHENPASMFATRLLWPFTQRRTATGKQGDVLDMLMKWNADRPPDQQRWFMQPARNVQVRYRGRIRPVTESMSEDEYYLYARLGGLAAAKMIDARQWNIEAPTEIDVVALERMFSAGRSKAMQMVKAARQAKALNKMDEYQRIIQRMKERIAEFEKGS